MATGRIGVTPTLRTRWSKAPAGGTTSLSGLDDNSVSLVYDVGYEAVYRNGVLLSRTNDYTATTGNSITLIDATIAGDIIEVFANQLLPLTNAIGNGQYTAKGALLSATAASTPAVLTVGSNDTVLTADSSTATGLKWATPAAGGMTLLSTTSLTGANVDITGISQNYQSLHILITGVTNATSDGALRVRPDGSANNGVTGKVTATDYDNFGNISLSFEQPMLRTSANNAFALDIFNYTSTTTYKPFTFSGLYESSGPTNQYVFGGGCTKEISAVDSLFLFHGGGDFSTGTVRIYGVK